MKKLTGNENYLIYSTYLRLFQGEDVGKTSCDPQTPGKPSQRK